MLKRILTLSACAALMFAFTACCDKKEAADKHPIFKNVVLIGSDGFSSEIMRLHPGKFPHIEQLMKDGSWTLESRSVLPSSSAINWATILMGAGSEMHGFTEWGSTTPEVKPIYTNKYGLFPTIFGEVRQQMPAAQTGVLYSWGGIGYLFEKEAVNLDFRTKDDDDSIALRAIEYFEKDKPTLSFVYFSQPDGAGHGHGWVSEEYVEACVKIDSLVGEVVASIRKNLDPNTAIVFTSDHGGINKGHGGKTMEEMESPFIMVGPGIPADTRIERIVMNYDITPTMADMLGITSPEQWRGKSLFAK